MFQPNDFFNLNAFSHRQLFEDEVIIYVWDVLKSIPDYLQKTLRPQILGDVHAAAFLIDSQIYIGSNVVVEPGAYIQGPCFIGAGTVIRHGAYIRGNVIIGKNCIVGHASEVKNAVLFDGASIPHFNYVGDSVVGAGVNMGAGSRLANFKLQGSEIIVRHGTECWPTGLQKFGAILGDGVSIGCNAVCNPGTLLGPKSLVYPLSAVQGYHPAGSLIKS